MTFRILAACVCLLASGCATTDSGPKPESWAEVDSIVSQAITSGSMPGVSVAVESKGRLVFSRSYGMSRLADRRPVDNRTLFRIGSISKLVTAAAIMRLVEEGRIQLDDPIAGILADRPQVARLPRDATIRRLLNHTSGISNISPSEIEASIREDGTMSDAEADIALARPPIHRPGGGWSYNDVAYRLLSWVVERFSNMSFNDYVTDELAERLELPSLRSCDIPGAAKAEGYIPRQGSYGPDLSYGVRGLLGEGGLCATAEDLARLPGRLRDGRFIRPSTLATMTQPTALEGGARVDYGLGIRRGAIGGTPLWGHTGGGLAGSWAAVAHYPELGLTVAVTANGSGGPEDAMTLQGKIAAVLLGDMALKDEPLDAAATRALAGAYTDGDSRVCFEPGATGLVRRVEGSDNPGRTLVHQGGEVFARADYPLDRYAFQVAGGSAIAHSVYFDGYFVELLLPDGACRSTPASVTIKNG